MKFQRTSEQANKLYVRRQPAAHGCIATQLSFPPPPIPTPSFLSPNPALYSCQYAQIPRSCVWGYQSRVVCLINRLSYFADDQSLCLIAQRTRPRIQIRVRVRRVYVCVCVRDSRRSRVVFSPEPFLTCLICLTDIHIRLGSWHTSSCISESNLTKTTHQPLRDIRRQLRRLASIHSSLHLYLPYIY